MPTLPADTAGLPQRGDLIAGKYQVEDVLGKGGMGVVVSARHLALRQRVAVKFLLPSAATQPEATERFLREARAASAIQNEHVARVLDVGTLETGAPFMVMEYLTGTDLSRVLKARGKLTVIEAVDFILQAGEAIAEAHALGIIHRDLKPGNIFVTTRTDGSPFIKVLDFGLSKVATPDGYGPDELSLTATDAVIGSPPYMSPEQIRSLRSVDARTDIWSLGVILYMLLAGRRPFVGESTPAIYVSIAADTPASLSERRADVPPALDQVILRCLEKDVGRRVQNMTELAYGLAPFGSPDARVSLERIARVARGATSTSTLSSSAPAGPRPPLDAAPATPRPPEVQDAGTAQASVWSQGGAPARRMPVIRVLAAVGALLLIVIIAIGSIRRLNAHASAPAVADAAVVAAPPPSSSSAPGVDSAPPLASASASASASATVSATAGSSRAIASSSSAAPPAKAKGPPAAPPRAKPADPLERWK